MNKNDREYQELKNSVKLWIDTAIDEDLNSNSAAGKRRNVSRYIVCALCAALLVAVSATTGTYFLGRDSVCPEWKEVISAYGDSKSVTLSDGSVIRLRNDSRILYPEKFTGRYRQVFASGEVYADIAKDRHHPFILSSNGVNVKVKGTKFNYRAYGDSPKVELALVEGAVEMTFDISGAEKVLNQEPG